MHLKHKGYTFYQASFAELNDGREATVLAVVQNSEVVPVYIKYYHVYWGVITNDYSNSRFIKKILKIFIIIVFSDPVQSSTLTLHIPIQEGLNH